MIRRFWTSEEDEILRRLYPDLPAYQVAEALGRTTCSVFQRARLLGLTGVHPNCRRTQFTKGVLRGTAKEKVKPLGTERLSKDGILQRKVNNDLPFQRRWRSVHSLVWEAAHGPIPPGHKVVFKPGQHTAVAELITPEKLELVSCAELMRRNSFHTRYPKEIGQLIQLRGALNRKINRLSKGESDEKPD